MLQISITTSDVYYIMYKVQCKKHKIEFQLPTVEEEYVSGSFHDDIELLCSHHERYPKCRFEEIKN